MKLFSDIACRTYDNGVRACYCRRPVPSVEIQFHILTGSIHEGKDLGCGLSHFLEHMSFQGCRDYPALSIADTVNRLGGEVNAYTSYDRTCYRMRLRNSDWREGVKMLASMVRYPELPEERFCSEREVILRECERCDDNPDGRLWKLLMRNLFLQHPLRHPVIGYREMIAGVTREMAMAYHDRRYTPERCFIVAVGGTDPEEFFAELGERIGDWARSELLETVLPDEAFPFGSRKEELIFADPAERILCGVRLPSVGSAELPALDILLGMLGAGENSLLNRRLVLEKQIALGTRSFCLALAGTTIGGWTVEATPAKFQAAASEMRKATEELVSGKFSKADFEREKYQQYADRLRALRDSGNAATEIAVGMTYAGNPALGDAYLTHLASVNPEEVVSAASRYFQEDRIVTVSQRAKSAVKKSSASAANETMSFNRMANGAGEIVVPDHSLPLCTFSLILPGGAVFEPDNGNGVSRIVAAMLTSGTRRSSEIALLKRLDECGADLDFSAGANSMILEMTAPRNRFNSAVSVLAEILAEPLFPQSAFERERNLLLEELRVNAMKPLKAAFNAGLRALMGDHPYASIGGLPEERLLALTRDDVEGFYRSLWNPAHCAFACGGDCDERMADKWIERIASVIPWSDPKPLHHASDPVFPAEMQKLPLTLPREQTVALRLLPGIALARDPANECAKILSQSENGLASRLFKSVREKNALSYAVGMSLASGFCRGSFGFYAMTAPGCGEKVLSLLDEEIARLCEKGLDKEEFEAARSGALFACDREVECCEDKIKAALLDFLYGFDPVAESGEQRRRLEALSLAAVNSTLPQFLSSAAGVSVLVEPENRD